jgi:ParB family chromosome partitioning protein
MGMSFSEKMAHQFKTQQTVTAAAEAPILNVTSHYETSKDEIKYIPLKDIFADEDFNCRGRITPIDVVDLAKNIEEQGLIQPIIVQPWNGKTQHFRVVAGYRRYVAHVVNRAETIKCIIKEGLSEDDARFLNLAENLNREDLNIMQEAKVIKGLLERGHTQEEIKTRLNCSRMWVQVRQYALALPGEIQAEIKNGWLKQEHILALYSLRNNPERQMEAAKEIKEKKQRGETVRVTGKSLKKDAKSKMARNRKMIQNMMDHIFDSVGKASFGTRCLAWASGEISSEELYEDIKEEAEDVGRVYYPPRYDIASEI